MKVFKIVTTFLVELKAIYHSPPTHLNFSQSQTFKVQINVLHDVLNVEY